MMIFQDGMLVSVTDMGYMFYNDSVFNKKYKCMGC